MPEALEKLTRKRTITGATRTDSTQINMALYHIIADWYHFAILTLAKTKDFKEDPDWIGKRLEISPHQANAAIERMEKLGLLIRKKNRIESTEKMFSTSDEIPNAWIRKAHHQDLELARKSLDEDNIEKRDFTSVYLAINPRQIPEAKRLIREFRDKMISLLEENTKQKSEVYNLAFQLYPISRGEE